MANNECITTGQLADRGGVNIETVRFYERQGLLPKPARTSSGYRLFTDESVRQVRFIKRAQALGFSLREVKELLALSFDASTSCTDIRRKADQKLSQTEQKIKDLQRIKRTLTALAAACPGRGPTAECPILESIDPIHDSNGRAKPSARSSTKTRRR